MRGANFGLFINWLLLFSIGLVLELSGHTNEYASKYLTTQGPYILVEKQSTSLQTKNDTSDPPSPPQVSYVPLLECCNERFPNYHPRVATKGHTQGPPSPTRLKSKKLKKGKKSVSDKRELVSPNT